MKNYIYKSLRLIVVFAGMLLGAGSVYAQANKEDVATNEQLTEIVGVVYDAATNETLAGVRVEALGNKRYTAMTKPDGTFAIKIPAFVASLYVSTPGYEAIVVKARQGKDLVLYLYDEAFSTFVENKFDVTAKSEAHIDVTKAKTLETEVQNQMGADVRTITRSGTIGLGGIMMMQGISSLNTSAQPLIVLDGVMQDLQDSYTTLHNGYYNNVLAGIDVNDIEKITVLKNATALYGAKGGNGVILVDTKRGHSQATRIDASVYGTYTLKPNLPEMMNAEQFRIYANELLGGIETEQTNFPFLSDDKSKYYWQKY
ncbi:MAG: TonB-dependent receptor plug domain-containing protein, partial [Rikenellaceae bacterium]|nr:TonB-dependent receptor plug domain-containing protein [Rikenellaceae bacterium]